MTAGRFSAAGSLIQINGILFEVRLMSVLAGLVTVNTFSPLRSSVMASYALVLRHAAVLSGCVA